MHYNLQKTRTRNILEEANNMSGDMPIIFKAINTIQNTEWIINQDVYKLIHTCLKDNYRLGNLPVNPDTIELPPKIGDLKNDREALKDWKRKANNCYKQRHKEVSKFIQVHQIMQIASKLLNKSCYFPHQYDFRWRIYPKPALLNPQGADWSRTLLTFKYGKRLKTEEALNRLKIAGAGLYGETDKEDLGTRLKWVDDNEQRIISTAKNPLEDNWWSTADKPFAFYSWCNEYKKLAEEKFSLQFISSIPIQADCSNSGLQHYSAMLRDEIGGKATNLIPDNKPQDVYGMIAEKVKAKLLKKKSEKIASLWLAWGIDRKICKKSTMCLPYGLTKYSCRQYLEDEVLKQQKEKGKVNPFGDNLFKATQYLTPIVWDSIGEIVVGARKVMKYVQTISRLVASENLPVTWITPLNAPVQMLNYKMENKRVKTKMGDSIIKVSIQRETKNICPRATAQSVAPNLIHSIDACLLMKSVVMASERGVDSFSIIHDSFGVVASDYNIMAKSLRESFIDLYSEDLLKQWSTYMYDMLSDKNKKKFPEIPKQGTLKLDDVLQSEFFCI